MDLNGPLSNEELELTLKAISIPDISNRKVKGRGFWYTPEEDKYLLEVKRAYLQASQTVDEAVMFLSEKLDRPMNGVRGRLIALERSTLGGETRSNATKDESRSSAVVTKQTSNNTEAGNKISHKTLHNRLETNVPSNSTDEMGLSAIAVPDTSSRKAIGRGFIYSHEEDQYLLAMKRIYLQADRSVDEAVLFMSKNLHRPVNGVRGRLFKLERVARGGESGVSDASTDEANSSTVTRNERITAARKDGSSSTAAANKSSPTTGRTARRASTRRYTAEETASLCSTYEKYRLAGRTLQSCMQIVATELGRSKSSVGNRIVQLRSANKLPRWSGSQHSRRRKSKVGSFDGDSEDDEENEDIESRADSTSTIRSVGRSDVSLQSADSNSSAAHVSVTEPTSTANAPGLGSGKRKDIPTGRDVPERSFWSPLRGGGDQLARSQQHTVSTEVTADRQRKRRKFTVEEDAVLHQAYLALSADASSSERREVSRRLAAELSRTAEVVQQRAGLLGYRYNSHSSIPSANS